MYGDTSVIRRHARAMRERGERMRQEATLLLAEAETVAWTGWAADAMRRLSADHATRLRRCADAHDDAADALERHAREVDRLVQLIAAAEHRALALLDSVGSGLEGLGHWARSFEPPLHGSRAWLHVSLPVLA